MPNWNVYKVFASGKRAKSPYTTFEAEQSQHFFENILPTLGAKLKKSNWIILDAEQPQERPEGGTMSADDVLAKKRNRILSKIAVEALQLEMSRLALCQTKKPNGNGLGASRKEQPISSLGYYQRSLILERRLSRGSTRLASSTQDWRSNQSC